MAKQALEQHLTEKAVFITNDGSIIQEINLDKLTVFCSIGETLDNLQLVVLNAKRYQNEIFIRCQTSMGLAEVGKQGYSIKPSRRVMAESPLVYHRTILSAMHWANWDEISKFCGGCGSEFINAFESLEKSCSQCDKVIYPQLSPAIMVLISKGEQILLARSPHFTSDIYSAIAGFIDMGESAENAVHREVEEEVGLSIQNLRYFSSQAWPFPSSFMIAYHADYLGGNIVCGDEIEDAKWFHKEALPKLPMAPSISRSLIESVLN
ncbi:MAG TPA: NAD(+) diphosphatase [Gammaproteobacteria bacterium]|nr:NAD(+) diphosphatase [Gammaproteobacteria bacterium]